MTPNKRSTLRLDLKDISSRSTGPNIGRATLVAGSVLAVSIAVASINMPSDESGLSEKVAFSAPVDSSSSERKKTFKAEEVILADATSFNTRSVVDIPAVEPEPVTNSADEEAPSKSFAVETEEDVYQKEERDKERHHPIQLASLSPIPSSSISEPLVNLVSEEPAILKSEPPLPLSVTSDDEKDAEPIVLANAAPLKTLSESVLNQIEGDSVSPSLEGTDTIPGLIQENTQAEQPAAPEPEIEWVKATVKKKDTLSQIFNRVGLSSKEAYRLVKLKGTKPLTRIRPGQVFEVAKRLDEKGDEKLQSLRLKVNRFDTLVIEYDESEENGFTLNTETREPEVRFTTSSATISGSLLGAAKRAGIPYDTVYEMATIFGWQVDFSKDIQKGDQFTVVHEELYLDDVKVGDGAVLAAELRTGKKSLQAVRHVYEDGHVSYYAPNGDGIQGSFLRSPIKFAKVSSKFSKKRFHPIKKKWRAHKGVDYSAPMKTPIRATGDGMVKFAGRKKGYGKTIILRHGGKYETVYTHMNHFKQGLKNGSRVKQGEVIGYVGMTGWTTGPHLHYEFRVHGKHMNPLTVELPKSAPIEERYASAFSKEASKWMTKLAQHGGTISLAQNKKP